MAKKIPTINKINFEDVTTATVASTLYERFKNNRFQVLNMFTGHGKTAIAVKMVGLMA